MVFFLMGEVPFCSPLQGCNALILCLIGAPLALPEHTELVQDADPACLCS